MGLTPGKWESLDSYRDVYRKHSFAHLHPSHINHIARHYAVNNPDISHQHDAQLQSELFRSAECTIELALSSTLSRPLDTNNVHGIR